MLNLHVLVVKWSFRIVIFDSSLWKSPIVNMQCYKWFEQEGVSVECQPPLSSGWGGWRSCILKSKTTSLNMSGRYRGLLVLQEGGGSGARARGFPNEQVWTGPSISHMATPCEQNDRHNLPTLPWEFTTWKFGTYGGFLEYVTLPFSIWLHNCIKCKVFRKECVLKLDLSLNWSCSRSRKRKTWRKRKSMCQRGLVLSLQQSYYHQNTTIFEDESGGGFWSKKNPECSSEVSIL